MICPPCKAAGDALGGVKLARSQALRDLALVVARQRHSECEAPGTCPCHHQLDLDALTP